VAADADIKLLDWAHLAHATTLLSSVGVSQKLSNSGYNAAHRPHGSRPLWGGWAQAP